ncbi:EXOSC1 domain containing protein [Trichuris trichiura]|uniref:EXOSC1 domain containing protein n=1 Tax=Trichuris trichiura TaxID=36087 RepID=A0A077Z933_TRITR|nr:EXOSC1 domain containing protein [Trichuris trichiura]
MANLSDLLLESVRYCPTLTTARGFAIKAIAVAEITFRLLCPGAMPQSDKFDSLNGTPVIPGDKIVKYEPILVAGEGCTIMYSCIYATLVGYVSVKPVGNSAYAVIDVEPNKSSGDDLPKIGSLVTCRILNVTASYATCAILAVMNKPVSKPYSGVIRKEDTVTKRKEQANVLKFVGSGDIVLAKVHKMFGCSDRAIRCEECCIEEERKVAIGSRALALRSLSSGPDDSYTNGT